MTQNNPNQNGWKYAVACYAIWGLFPIYWYPLNQSAMPADQIIAHRVVWSALFALFLLLLNRQAQTVWAAFRQPKLLATFALSAFLIGINWLVYLWAIVNHRVLDASLGYFINPLVNVFLGRLIFKETLNRAQMLALVLALLGIFWLAIPAGQIPWVALLLASSFAGYGLIRKLAPMDALAGLALETLLLLPLAVAYLAWCVWQDEFVFRQLSTLQLSVLFGSGVATTLPLLYFAKGAKRISMALLGMLQYISPTLQFICGLILFNEIFDAQRFVGFAFVWAGVLVFLCGMVWQKKAA